MPRTTTSTRPSPRDAASGAPIMAPPRVYQGPGVDPIQSWAHSAPSPPRPSRSLLWALVGVLAVALLLTGASVYFRTPDDPREGPDLAHQAPLTKEVPAPVRKKLPPKIVPKEVKPKDEPPEPKEVKEAPKPKPPEPKKQEEKKTGPSD